TVRTTLIGPKVPVSLTSPISPTLSSPIPKANSVYAIAQNRRRRLLALALYDFLGPREWVDVTKLLSTRDAAPLAFIRCNTCAMCWAMVIQFISLLKETPAMERPGGLFPSGLDEIHTYGDEEHPCPFGHYFNEDDIRTVWEASRRVESTLKASKTSTACYQCLLNHSLHGVVYQREEDMVRDGACSSRLGNFFLPLLILLSRNPKTLELMGSLGGGLRTGDDLSSLGHLLPWLLERDDDIGLLRGILVVMALMGIVRRNESDQWEVCVANVDDHLTDQAEQVLDCPIWMDPGE
ncbi:hypothetical protein P7C70_g9179, partial [Phenoliferia sp. Uapishka_3]